MSTDDLRDALAETIRAAEPYIYADPADARELADALLPIIEAHTAAAVAEVREQIAGWLDGLATKERSSLPADDMLWSYDDWADERGASCYDHAARIVRGQA